jgi:hypothetical protein
MTQSSLQGCGIGAGPAAQVGEVASDGGPAEAIVKSFLIEGNENSKSVNPVSRKSSIARLAVEKHQ